MARYGTKPGGETRVYTAERPGAELAMLLQRPPGPERHLHSLASFYSVEHAILATRGADLARGLAAVIAEIVAERPAWERLYLAELDPREDAYGRTATALRRAGFLVECVFHSATWYEETAGLGFADYLAQRPAELRNTWRRSRRKAEAAGRLTRAFVAGSDGVEQAIADYQAVYAASWKEPEPFAEFIPALIRLAAQRGVLRLGVYYIDGAPAAAQFWIVQDGRAIIYKLAHDQRYDALSLGTLLTMDMIERVLEQDEPREINFGRGDDPYKKLWLPRRRERWGIVAANPRTLGGLRFGLWREAAKVYHRLRGEAIVPAR